MSSRDDILAALRRARPAPVALPEPAAFARPDVDLVAHFERVMRDGGGHVIAVANGDVAAAVAERYPAQQTVASAVPERVAGNLPLDPDADPHTLAGIDVLVCEGVLGVAENGAIWVPESRMGHRAAPFLAQHLAVVLAREQIVWNLHEAYARLAVDAEGFGLFVAGPSKTADIEQALVVGAHGPRSLTVLLV